MAVDAAGFAAVDDLAASFVAAGRAPSLAYGVVADGHLVHSGGAGRSPGSADAPSAASVFRIASMTKSFTAAAVLLLRDEGRLQLDDPIVDYVPAAAGLSPVDGQVLTLRLLLTMAGGFPTDDPWADRQESLSPRTFDALLAAGPRMAAVPGTAFQYSNLGYAIAGRAVAAAAGVAYRDFVTERLLRPLGLDRTRFAAADLAGADLRTGYRRSGERWVAVPFDVPGEFSPIGGLLSTVADLAIWIAGFLSAHRPQPNGDGHPLSAASRREMQQLQRFVGVAALPAPDGAAAPHALARGYGLGLTVEHGTRWGEVVGHSGGYPGFGSNMRWHPATGIGVVMLANSTYAGPAALAQSALDVLVDGAAAPAPQPWPELAGHVAAARSLLAGWDDALADAVFAPNMDLDVPRAERRELIFAAVARLGPLDNSAASAERALGPAAAEFALHGRDGSLRVELRLSPEPAPRIQALVLHES